MCGLFGIAGYGITTHDLDVVQELGIVSMLRGVHASGVFEANSRTKVQHLIKDSEDFAYLNGKYNTWRKPADKGDRLFNSQYMDVIMGHTRHATVGELTAANAQPFEHKGIVGCHNGTLIDWEYNDYKSGRSDSDFFMEDISNRGVPQVLWDLDKASHYAIVVYDKKEKKLTFARSLMRPLAFAVNQKRNVMYWASESAALRYVLNRKGIEFAVTKDNVTEGSIYHLMDGVVFDVAIKDIAPRKDIMKPVLQIYQWVKGAREPLYSKDVLKKQQEEEKLKKQLELYATEVKDETPETVEVSDDKEDVDDNIVPFPPPFVKNKATTKSQSPTESLFTQPQKPGKDFTKPCGMCGEGLSVYEQYRIKTEEGYGYYRESENKYFCADCCIPGLENATVKSNKSQNTH